MRKGATKREAREEMRALEDQVSRGVYLPRSRVPLFSEVSKEWIEYKKAKIRISTWGEYKRQIEKHLQELDSIKINSITVATIEKFISKRQERGMNINTLRRILVTLNQIMNYAVRHRYIDHNPVREAERPRNSGNGMVKQEKAKVLDPSEIKKLVDSTEDCKYRMIFLLAAFTGARQGEILGLKWTDVDWEEGQIHIQRTYNHGRFFPPKSEASNRRVDVGPTVLKELRKWKLACPRNDFNLVFPSETGTPVDQHHMIPRHFKPALKKANLPKVRFHDLRHTYASLLIEQGEDVKYIQDQLGHSSPTVTLDVYTHLMKKRNPEAALRLEKAIFAPTGSKTVAK